MRFALLVSCLASAALCSAQSSVNLLFTGDIMQHDAQISAAYDEKSDSYDYSLYFSHFGSLCKNADLAICNFEVTLGGKPYKGYPSFSAPDDYLSAIKDAGFDLFLTANNHCLDKGSKGLERTIAQMNDANVLQIGTYKDSLDRRQRYPALTPVKNVNIVFLNYTYATNGLKPSKGNVVNYIDKQQIKADIQKAKALKPDFIIACIHWGVERAHKQNAEQSNLARWLIDQGVDHIIGAHPHCVQPAEIITSQDGRKHLIFYSLGNFISNMSGDGCEGGIIVGLTLDKNNYNLTAQKAWWTIYKTAKPSVTNVKNFTAFPSGYDGADLPSDEASRLNDFILDARKVMQQGDFLIEKSCKTWGW